MCHRMSPLELEEMREALRALRETGHARVPRADSGAGAPDAYPGSQVPLFVCDPSGQMDVAVLTWGFKSPGAGSKLVFNTRIETALSQARSGRGLWAGPITEGRCLVPVRGFYENADRRGRTAAAATPGGVGNPSGGAQGEKVPQVRRGTGAARPPARPQYRFRLAGHGVFLLACVRDEERFSVVTCEPNADVAPIHFRMPLVLGPGESHVWLGPDFASLADRSAIRLTSEEA